MSDTDKDAQQSDAGTGAPQETKKPAQESQQTADLPDEAENADQYLHWSGRSADTDKIEKK